MQISLSEHIKKELGSIKKQYDWNTDLSSKIKRKLNIEGDYVILYHYGKPGLSILDPKQAVNQRSGHTPDFQQWNVPRVFYYINKKDKEWMVDGVLYKIKFPLNKLYPFNEDPLNFYSVCQKKYGMEHLSVGSQLSCIGEMAKKNGFDGMILSWGNTYRVDIWEKVKGV